LGSVVNSGIVYQGAPASALAGNAYATFQQTHIARTPVVLTNANDGMLHAFRASDGQELFAYIPGFIVPRLNALADPAATEIAVDSLGRRRCNSSSTTLKPCWP
jgi:type IV pilus assembly protein PilY1